MNSTATTRKPSVSRQQRAYAKGGDAITLLKMTDAELYQDLEETRAIIEQYTKQYQR